MTPKWEKVPDSMRNDHVKKYFDLLITKKPYMICKRLFDIVASLLMIIILSPVFLIIAIMIKVDSKGPVFYRQERATQYNKAFRIFKFRTMVEGSDKIGPHVTVENDSRVTKVGNMLRSKRIDEIPQLFNVLKGDMTFVGTRPEALKYVNRYTDEMMATLLLPAGVTSRASLAYKDEAENLIRGIDTEYVYVNKILPEKMAYNFNDLKNFGLKNEARIILDTVKIIFS